MHVRNGRFVTNEVFTNKRHGKESHENEVYSSLIFNSKGPLYTLWRHLMAFLHFFEKAGLSVLFVV